MHAALLRTRTAPHIRAFKTWQPPSVEDKLVTPLVAAIMTMAMDIRSIDHAEQPTHSARLPAALAAASAGSMLISGALGRHMPHVTHWMRVALTMSP